MFYRHHALIQGHPGQYPMRRILTWAAAAAFVLLSFGFVALAHHPAKSDPRLVYPRIHAAGGVLPQGPDALMPSAAREHRLLINVDSDATSEDGVNPSLKAAAKMLNLYALAGIPSDKVKMVLLFYGRGVRLALSDTAYNQHFHANNPNAALIAQLGSEHVQMVACGQALGHQMLTERDLHGGIQLALSALTAREDLQAKGYQTVPVE